MNIDDDIGSLSPAKAALMRALIADRAAQHAPRNEAERVLCEEWTTAFGRPVGPLDDFFALGGDSIQSLRLAARMQQRGWAMRGAQVFAHPTIRSLAAELQPAPEPADRDERSPASFAVPLTPMQQGMLYQVQTAGRTDVYVSQFLCRFADDLDLARLRLAWQRLGRRRAVLRSAIDFDQDGLPLMRVTADVDLPIEVHDWRGWSPQQVERALQALSDAERLRGFDLEQAPLMRLALARTPEGWHCVWTHHHLLLDGWSQLALLEDLFACHGDPDLALEDDGAAVRAFVAAQPARLEPGALDYWRHEFDGSTRCSFPPDAAGADDVDEAFMLVPPALATALSTAAGDHGTTPAVALELVWGLVVASMFQREDPVFGLVSAVRPAAARGVERTAWMCINTTPVRVRLDAGQDWLAGLAQRAQARRAQQERVADPLPEVLKACPGAGFGTVLVIENFHRDVRSSVIALGGGLEPDDVRFRVREHHPVVCVVSGTAPRLEVRIKVDRLWRVPLTAGVLLARWMAAAHACIDDPRKPLREVAQSLDSGNPSSREMRHG